MKIQFVHRNNIDTEKWDNLIDQSHNGRIYSKSWYLDTTCKKWGAFIANDYDAVMPVPYFKKYGIRVILPPFFLQQLGIFSKEPLSGKQISSFENKLKWFSPYILYSFNSSFFSHSFKLKKGQKANHTLNISPSYEELYKSYRRNTKRNIKKGLTAGLIVKQSTDISTYIELVRSELHTEVEGIKAYHYDNIRKLARESLERKCGEILEVRTGDKQLAGVGFFVQHKGNHTFLICASNEEGKKNNAMYLLVDAYLQKYAGKGKTFDFSGSNISGVAYFNEGFGAKDNPYTIVSSKLFL